MSCQIDVLSVINDAVCVKKFLFPNWADHATTDKTAEVSWNDDNWSWKEDEDVDDKDGKDKVSWYQQCIIGISSVGDAMVLATGKAAVFLSLKWDNNEEGQVKEKFFVNATEVLTDDPEDEITAVLCLPLASMKRSSHGRPDWTAVIVGFRSGYVRMYTESGVLLADQLFHRESVISIKCRTFERYSALAEQSEELTVLYETSVVIIDGLGLYQMLRGCRNQAAKALATSGDSGVVDAAPMTYKKWKFQDHNYVADCENVGVSYLNSFDQMMHESVNRGQYGSYRGESPAATLFVTTGKDPYVCFYYAVEGTATPFLGDLAWSLATNKLKSIFGGIFGQEDKTKKMQPKIEPPTALNSRFQIRDYRRRGFSISTSPNRRLSVISDDFGRVVLVDNNDGSAVRIWKGYRDAECGWIESAEERQQLEAELRQGGPQRPPRIALFLVIYCPRRGILEVWSMQQGPRVAAFSIGRNARLLSSNHGILGLTNVTSVKECRTQNRHCYLIDGEGCIKAVTIPFHYSLSAKHGRRARDLHLLNKVKLLLKDKSFSEDSACVEISNSILDIKIASMRQQMIEILIKHKNVSTLLLKTVISRLVNYFETQEPDSIDYESKLLLRSCQRQKQLLELYDGIHRLNASEDCASGEEYDDEKPLQALSAMLHLSEPEIDHFLSCADRFFASTHTPKGVHFEDGQCALRAGKFLSHFVTQQSLSTKESARLAAQPEILASSVEHSAASVVSKINLASHLTTEDFSALAVFLFHTGIQNSFHLLELQGLLMQSGVNFQNLLYLLLEYWLQLDKGMSDWQLLRNFHNTVLFLSSLTDSEEVIAAYNGLSPWWSSCRRQLSSSSNIAAAFTASLVCRGVAVTLASCQQNLAVEASRAQSKDELATEELEKATKGLSVKVDVVSCGNSTEVSLTDWENVDMDIEHWSLLIKQLEDLIVLNTLLKHRVKKPLLADCWEHSDNSDTKLVTVDSIVQGGRGAVSELVSVWMTRLNTDCIQRILLHYGLDDDEDRNAAANTLVEEAHEAISLQLETSIAEIEDLLEGVRKHFPYSVHRDILLANCCWELAVLWNKDKCSVGNLQNSVLCLKYVITTSWGKGLATFLWHTFIKKPFISAARLIEKVRKVPKDRLCRKDVEMGDSDLDRFIGSCAKLLDLLMRVGYSWDRNNASLFCCEETWQTTSGSPPLTDIAAGQKEPNIALVCQNYKLALCLHMILVFNLKFVKPLTLCDPRSMDVFHDSLTSNATVHESVPNQATVNDRTQFLKKVITAAVVTIPEPTFDDPDHPQSMQFRITSDHGNASMWIGNVIKLANLWTLDADVLWRHYVCELYSSGLDSLAEEIISTVSDRELLGSQLLLIAGQRIHETLSSSGDDYLEKLAMFPPMVTSWLATLNQNPLRCPNPPLSMTATMCNYILNVIAENQAEYKMAISLVEPLQQLIQMDLYTRENSETQKS